MRHDSIPCTGVNTIIVFGYYKNDYYISCIINDNHNYNMEQVTKLKAGGAVVETNA